MQAQEDYKVGKALHDIKYGVEGEQSLPYGDVVSFLLCSTLLKAEPDFFTKELNNFYRKNNPNIKLSDKLIDSDESFAQKNLDVLNKQYRDGFTLVSSGMPKKIVWAIFICSLMAILSVLGYKFFPDSFLNNSWVNGVFQALIGFIGVGSICTSIIHRFKQSDQYHLLKKVVDGNNYSDGPRGKEFLLFNESYFFNIREQGLYSLSRAMSDKYSFRDMKIYDSLGINIFTNFKDQKKQSKNVLTWCYIVYAELLKKYIKEGKMNLNGKALVNENHINALEAVHELFNEKLSFGWFDFKFDNNKYQKVLSGVISAIEYPIIKEMEPGGLYAKHLPSILKEIKEEQKEYARRFKENGKKFQEFEPDDKWMNIDSNNARSLLEAIAQK